MIFASRRLFTLPGILLLIGSIFFSGATQLPAKEPDLEIIGKAVKLIRADKLDQATALAQKRLEDEKGSVEALVILAECCVWKDEPLQAIEYLEQAVKSSKKNAHLAYAQISTPLVRKLYRDDQVHKYSVGYFESEFERWNAKVMEDPQEFDLLHARALTVEEVIDAIDSESMTLADKIRYNFAIADMTMAISAGPESDQGIEYCSRIGYRYRACLWEWRGDLFEKEGYQNSANDLRRMIEYSSKPEEELPELAQALFKAGKSLEALALVPEKFDGLDGSTIERWLDIQQDCLMEQKQFAAAEQVLTKLMAREALASDQDLLHHRLLNRAQCYFELRQYKKAHADLDRSMELDSHGIYLQWSWKYKVMLREGRWDEIQAAIDGEEGPNNFPGAARSERADYLMEMERWEEARKDLVILNEIENGKGHFTHRDLATVYEKLGKLDEAKKHAARAKEIFDAYEPWEQHMYRDIE